METSHLILVRTNGHGRSASFWVDSLTVLEKVYLAVQAGGRIVYANDVRRYKVKGRHVWGPSGNFDVLFGGTS